MSYFRYWFRVIYITFICLSAPLTPSAMSSDKQPISFVVAPDVLADYQQFMKGRQIEEILDVDAKLPRDTLEVLITLYTLHLGGLDFVPEFVATPSLERHISLLRSGTVAMSAALIDQQDLESVDGIQSIPSLFDGRARLAGLFTAPGNARALSATKREHIRELTAISNKSWRADWRALSNVKLAKLIYVADWNSMCRMVLAGRVDFLLAPLQSNREYMLQTPVGSLVQMRPFAVEIYAHRQFAISDKHPDSELLSASLEAGKKAIGPQHFLNDAIRQATPKERPTELLIILNKHQPD